jgi:hypothetical protein
MNNKEALSLIRSLSHSQGYYCRLLNSLNEYDKETRDEFLSQFKNCNDEIDMILQLEG